MKNMHIALIGCALLCATAVGDTVSFTLPTGQATQLSDSKNDFRTTGDLGTVKTNDLVREFGSELANSPWGASNASNINHTTNIFAANEGVFTLNPNGGVDVSMMRRNGVFGEMFGFTLQGGADLAGKSLTSITLSNTGVTGNPLTHLTLVLGIYDTAGNGSVISANSSKLVDGQATVSLTFDSGELPWLETYRIVGAVWHNGEGSGSAQSLTTVQGLSLQAETAAIPEPATATLSLLALAGLAARRRRK